MRPALAYALLASTAQAHYTFPSIGYNGANTADWEYVRITDNKWSNGPVTDVSSGQMTCYQSVMNTTGVKTMDVKAGSTVTYNAKDSISHPGPINAYMAKVPSGSSIGQFAATGAVFFKVLHDGPSSFASSGLTWPTQGVKSVGVKIPTCLQDGEYLLRIEHIGLHSAGSAGGAQLYISCAHLKVTGGSGTAQPKMLSFPGSYRAQDPGLLINIYWPIPTSYSTPGGDDLRC